jgi:hypothetical protein
MIQCVVSTRRGVAVNNDGDMWGERVADNRTPLPKPTDTNEVFDARLAIKKQPIVG